MLLIKAEANVIKQKLWGTSKIKDGNSLGVF